MDTTRRSLGVLTVGAAAALAIAGTAPVRAQSPDQAAIMKLIDTFREAFLKQDLAKLETLVADNVNYGHSSGTIENKAQFLAAVKARKGVMKSLKYSDIKVDVTGTAAIARHIWESESEVDGKTTQTKVGVMQVWQKAGDSWKIYARQAYRLPA
ncbi:MAG: nuclear transport factor 2 family protein [Hyphomicrobiaceae bacterium]